jgi:uncharacterized 2Fe-2S/4Fe-4S cluster protein (DUF4445 family)
MLDEDGTTAAVTFSPDKRTVRVPIGTNLLDACHDAGIAIDAVCGGGGKCGRCRVIPRGRFTCADNALVTDEERGMGVVLACETSVDGDLEVEIPPRSRIREHQILTRTVGEVLGPITPWLTKELVELPPATLYDNTADLERFMRSLGRRGVTVPIETLRNLPRNIRKGGWKVTATISELEPGPEAIRLEPGDTRDRLLGVAVDIGTTTVVAQLVDLTTGETLSTASSYNRQISRGEDVIARMMYGEEHGMEELTVLARETVDSVLLELLAGECDRSGRETVPEDIVAASVAGNTIMTHFFVGLDTRQIRLEPYVPVAHHMPPRSGMDLGMDMHPSGRVMLFPSRAGYLGGDVVADILASGMHRSDDIALLIDVGTNGEMVLGCRDWLVSCACSAGPAFEGGEVSCGMRAMDGAMDRVRVNDDLGTSYHVLGDEPPSGICGSGLIDLVAEMYAHGLIDRKARIQDLGTDRVRTTDSGREYVVEWRANMGKGSTRDIVVTDADMQNVLRTKAAIFGAATVLMRKMGEGHDDLDSVIIAGGFGNHLDIDRAISIGMFPDIARDRYRFIGNGALGGARLALLSADMRREVEEVFEELTYIELSVDNDFYDEFSSSLFIPHTDLGRFPSFVDRESGP